MLRRVFTYPDGSQVLVETRDTSGREDERLSGHVQTLATRPDRWAVWGPPMLPEYADDDQGGLT